MLKDIVIKIERIHFFTIVHTLPDNASLFAATLDQIKHPQIVSTLAGFDTLIIISENEYKAKIIKKQYLLRLLIHVLMTRIINTDHLFEERFTSCP